MAHNAPGLFHNVNSIDRGGIGWLPCSWVNSFNRVEFDHHGLSLPYLKHCNSYFLASITQGKHFHPISCTRNASTEKIIDSDLQTTALFSQSSRLSLQACRAMSEKDSGETSGGESILLDEQTLMQDLQIAIQEENYGQAAKIRDSLRLLKEDSKAAVLAANARFYNAFREGNAAEMQALWANGDHVRCVHPGACGVLGYDDLIESWDDMWMDYDFPLLIDLKNVQIRFRGDIGYVTCVEFVSTKGGSWGPQFVTNVFEKIDGQWYICIHHASPVNL